MLECFPSHSSEPFSLFPHLHLSLSQHFHGPVHLRDCRMPDEAKHFGNFLRFNNDDQLTPLRKRWIPVKNDISNNLINNNPLHVMQQRNTSLLKFKASITAISYHNCATQQILLIIQQSNQLASDSIKGTFWTN